MTEHYGNDSIFTVKSQKGFRAKTALMDAGIGLIADLGVHGFSISDLCKKAGLKRTSFYSYFETMEQFVDELSIRENSAFEADFEKLHGEAYTEMAPGLKRMVLSLLQFFAIAESRAVWNRFVVRLFSQHTPTAAAIFNDLKADIVQGIESGDLQLNTEDADTYAQLILASLSIGSQQTEQYSRVNGRLVIDMLLDAGKVKDKNAIEPLFNKGW